MDVAELRAAAAVAAAADLHGVVVVHVGVGTGADHRGHDEEGVGHLDRLERGEGGVASHDEEAQSVSMALDGEGDGDVGRGGDGADHAGGVGDARRLGEGLDERGEVDVVVEGEDGNHLGRRATAAALLEDLGAARVADLLRAERALSLVADADAGLRRGSGRAGSDASS